MQRFALLALLASATQAASNPPSCGSGQSACPKEYPCCSTDGTCGNGYVCLGGCDPRYSYEPGACVAMPVCQDMTWNFTSTDSISTYSDYLGDADNSTWSYLGNITEVDGKLRTQMFKGTTGSSVSSSRYIWYGRVDINLKSSHTGGVVSDFILLSNVKDEVDYEMVGSDTTDAQTNYYWHGALDYTKEVSAKTSDTYENYHTYSIDWQENQIQWLIDGNVVRTLNKSDTYNSTSNTYAYPQTPARIQFGLWPAGDSASQGTQEWAGGAVNWNAPDIQDPGYFYVEVESIKVQCYDPPSSAQKNGTKSYVYTSKDGVESSIAITDDDTVLGSTDGTGLNLDGSKASSSSSASSSGAAVTLSGASQSSTKSASSSGAAVTLSGDSKSSSLAASTTKSPSSSKSSASASATSSSDDSSSSEAASTGSAAANGAAASGATASSTDSSSESSSSSSSSSASQSADRQSNGGSLLTPAVGILPLLAML